MDEPGYPNLISLPFFNFCSNNDEIYLNTRKRILSEKNPFYVKGKFDPCRIIFSWKKKFYLAIIYNNERIN